MGGGSATKSIDQARCKSCHAVPRVRLACTGTSHRLPFVETIFSDGVEVTPLGLLFMETVFSDESWSKAKETCAWSRDILGLATESIDRARCE